MKRFVITFSGRTKGSIGIMRVFTETVEASDIASAVSKLYETHEHIQLVTHQEA